MKAKLFIFSVFTLCAIGMLFILSITSVRMYSKDPFVLFKKQLTSIFLGFMIMFLVSKLPFHVMKKISLVIFIISFVLVLSTLFVGEGKVKRWIHLPGFSIQPVEFFKIGIILLYSNVLSKIKREDIDFYAFLLFAVSFFVLSIPVLLQPDYGNFLLIMLFCFSLLFIKGVKMRYFFLTSAPVLALFFFFAVSSTYRMNRILAFLDPWKDPQGKGFQIIQSMVAYSSGGLSGVGIGEGTQKLFFLPEAHNDFIISSIAEETGMVGILLIILLLFFVIFIGFSSAISLKDEFAKLVVAGSTFIIGVEAVMNLYVSVGLMPAKGLPFPFVSYGGSSMLKSFTLAGIILSGIAHAEDDR